ncbi:adenosylmethionine--8-amino-7-oxononanoate transaminase [Halioxenophilus aromaticivorans]|uniref:Adenosylmethionine-8-amino-7-oxononanoate aminotransferase n=1 Tax=Halioxenophilus aromaticivorans TaxID=1306992 RepID=A0AAV3TXP1_9ALTE
MNSATLPPNSLFDDLVQQDRQYIWHPYSAVDSPAPLYPVERAEGARLHLSDGRVLIDGMSSWWAVIHGYNHPELNQALTEQVDQFAHVMFGGLTHKPAVRLAQWLVEHTPDGLAKVFFSDSGSVAVEVAIKMALQYWQSKSQTSKHQLLSLRRGYHGDTFSAMSVCDPTTGMHHLFNQVLKPQIFSQSPPCGFDQTWQEHYIDDFRQQIETHHETLAAVILEPIVQGAGGMNFYSPVFLKRVRELCDEYDCLLIADEIATGFGRTGELFACNHSGISPDIMCVGKALTGGYMTLAATLCSDKVATAICQGEASVLMHGPTFMANPLACSVALKSCQLLVESPWQARVANLAATMKQLLAPCASMNHVAEVRVLGGIGVVELKNPVELAKVQDKFVQAGIWVRPFGKLVYIMPPFVIEQADLIELCEQLVSVVAAIHD